mgnify:CR=1 FL=1
MTGGNPSKSEETDAKKNDNQKSDNAGVKLNEEMVVLWSDVSVVPSISK